jgi:hypothetical protein
MKRRRTNGASAPFPPFCTCAAEPSLLRNAFRGTAFPPSFLRTHLPA